MTQAQKRTYAQLIAGMTTPERVQARIDRLIAVTANDPATCRRSVRELEALTLAMIAYLAGR